MVYSREQFIKWWEPYFPQIHDDDSGMWCYENFLSVKCLAFVQCKKVSYHDNDREIYWEWCNRTLKGAVICFSSSTQDDWWGFVEPDDALVWILKWVK